MTFNTLDQYEMYMQQLKDEQYERLTMAGDKEEEFNEMMKVMDKEIEKDKTGAVDKAVNQPNHYQFIDMSVEELIEAGLTHDEVIGWFKGNVIKYRMRAFKKGKVGPQDIAKANEYQMFYEDYKRRNTP